jgi:hypothetical protein
MESFLHLVATHVYRRLALLVVVEQLASPRSHLRWHNRLTLEFRDDLAYKLRSESYGKNDVLRRRCTRMDGLTVTVCGWRGKSKG